MRSIVKLTLSAFVAVAATGPAYAADMFLKLGPVKGEVATAAKGRENSVEVLSWQYGAARKGWDGSIKGGSIARKHVPSGTHIASADIVGPSRDCDDHNVKSPRDAATGMSSGRCASAWSPVATPVDRGSVRVKVKFPWLDCKVGARITDATLTSPTERVTFNDISVSRCAADEVDLDYAAVVVRGWDPATKQE